MNIDMIKIKPEPDFERLDKVLKRTGLPDRVPFFDLYSNLTDKLFGDKIDKSKCKDEEEYYLKVNIEYYYRLGYDYVPLHPNFGFKEAEKNGTYRQGSSSLISNEEDFEKYPWPVISEEAYSGYKKAGKLLYPGMKIIPFPRGVLENAMGMMGYEQFCYNLVEQPELVKKICDKIGGIVNKLLDGCAGMEEIGAVTVCEDMGFRTQTMISPEMLREYIFPWYKTFMKTVHSHDKAAIIHACGNLTLVYEDLIECGWDAKQSFEDVIWPVWEYKKRYGERMSAMGGFDVDKLSRMNEGEVRKHTRFLIDKCAPGGGYAMGTGNSVPEYIPVDNYLAMLEETFNYGKYSL